MPHSVSAVKNFFHIFLFFSKSPFSLEISHFGDSRQTSSKRKLLTARNFFMRLKCPSVNLNLHFNIVKFLSFI